MVRGVLLFGVTISVAGCGGSPFGLYPPADGGGLTGPTGSTGTGLYHPAGWAEPTAHGQGLEMQQEDCRGCHGQDLTGDVASTGVGCDSCHPAGWRTNCTFCHGGGDNSTGAPPRDLSGEQVARSFPAHTAHVSDRPIHLAFDCTHCHAKPSDVLSPGHVFDSTPGRSEVTLAGGLSSTGTYANGTCASLYCHGNGRGANGTYPIDGAPTTCKSCHPDATSGSIGWGQMSGRHLKHMLEGVTCSDCHRQVVNAGGNAIVSPALHVNGSVELEFSDANISRTNGLCSGFCHGEGHFFKSW